MNKTVLECSGVDPISLARRMHSSVGRWPQRKKGDGKEEREEMEWGKINSEIKNFIFLLNLKWQNHSLIFLKGTLQNCHVYPHESRSLCQMMPSNPKMKVCLKFKGIPLILIPHGSVAKCPSLLPLFLSWEKYPILNQASLIAE